MSVVSESTAVIASIIGDDPLADVAAAKLEEHGLLAPDLPEQDGDRHYAPEATPIYDQLKEQERNRKGEQ